GAPAGRVVDISVTLRSLCRHLALVTPSVAHIATVLREQDGLAAETAEWAASVSGGHVGRARRLATDAHARERRQRALALATAAAMPAPAHSVSSSLCKYAEPAIKL